MDCEEAVLSLEDSKQRVLIYDPMFKAAKLLLEMRSRVIDIYSHHWQEESAQPKKRWLSDGVRCELLKPGGRWQSGKIRMRICLEFCPDEPVSPLDNIPQQMKEADAER